MGALRPAGTAITRWRARRAIARRLHALRSPPDPSGRFRGTGAGLPSPTLDRAAFPVEFWERILGRHLSATTGFWPRWAKDVDRAESEWLQLVAERAGLAAGQRVLELGASLGAVSRWAETALPGLETVVTPHEPGSAAFLGKVLTAHGPQAARQASSSGNRGYEDGPFDRILVLEALTASADPVARLRELLPRLAPGGRLFCQAVCHWRHSYVFGPGEEHRWILLDTPDGALMPGDEALTSSLRAETSLLDRWELSGEHIERTVRAWRKRLDKNRAELEAILARSGDPRPKRSLRTCRRALAAQEVVFGFREGQEWAVTQWLLTGGSSGRTSREGTP